MRLARARGWVDAPGASDSGRKLQAHPVPVVGGVAILIGLLALEMGDGVALGDPVFLEHSFGLMFEGTLAWPPLLAAFLLGLFDDLKPGGLRPLLKLSGQVGVGFVVACSVFGPSYPLHMLLCLVFVPLFLNAWNTFDNADGAATGVGAVALLSVGSPAAAPLLGFLGWNLGPRSGAPAYLGDSGSHLLGCLVLLHPGAWPLALLPVLDLARVALGRVMSGRAPWRGDRSHLAHRLQARGLTPLQVALLLWALAALPMLWPGWGGVGLGGLGFLATVWASGACPDPEAPR
jgi:UDP-GlcNAc:undecaprenyl-phosphate GlcNAc-1-phosphate transferase